MPFIVPLKRTSISGSNYFSKYKSYRTSKLFLYQVLKEFDPDHKSSSGKDKSSTPSYRIITKGENIWYEIARGSNKLRREWSYLTGTLETQLLKENAGLTEDDEVKWLVAHCTKLALGQTTQKANHNRDRSSSHTSSKSDHELTVEDVHSDWTADERALSPVQQQQPSTAMVEDEDDDEDSLEDVYVLPTPSPGLQMSGFLVTLLLLCVFNIFTLLVHAADKQTLQTVLILGNIMVILIFVMLRQQSRFMFILAPIDAKPKDPFKRAQEATRKIQRRLRQPRTQDTQRRRVATTMTGIVLESKTDPRPVSFPAKQWSKTGHEQFKVRLPDYKALRQKGSSAVPFMQLAGVDAFQCAGKVEHIAKIVTLPQPKKGSPLSGLKDDGFGLPMYFIVNLMLPLYAPSMFQNPGDGEGMSIVLYFTLTGEQREEAMKLAATKSNGALALCERFFTCDLNDQKGLMGRLKGIGQVVNADTVDIGYALGLSLKQYNAKPWLTGPTCHRLQRGPGYVEVDIDFHMYAYPARKGCYSFQDNVDKFVLDLGFVVEGREEDGDTLPEQLIGCARVEQIKPKGLPNIVDLYPQRTKQLRSGWKKAGLL